MLFAKDLKFYVSPSLDLNSLHFVVVEVKVVEVVEVVEVKCSGSETIY